MGDRTKERLLSKGEQIREYGTCDEKSSKKSGFVSWHRTFVPIEVVGALSAFASTICSPVIQFYVIGYLNEEYSNTNSSTNGTMGVCSVQNNSSPHIQSDPSEAETAKAHWFMYMSLTSSFSAFFPTLFFGSLADKYGRKLFLAISLISHTGRYMFCLVMIRFRLPLIYMLIGSAIEGVTGSFGITFMIMMSVIADVTSQGNQRALRIIIAEAIFAVSFSGAEFLAAYWVKDENNYMNPIFIAIGLNTFALVYLICFIPETLDKTLDNSQGFKLKDCFNFVKIYTEKRNNRIFILNGFLICLALKTLSNSLPFVLYIQNIPFCWSPFKITMAFAITVVFQWPASLVGVKTMQSYLYLDQITIALIGCVSSALDRVFFGLAYLTDWLLYSTLLVGCVGPAIVPMIRAAMSKQVANEEQGSLFAGVACVERVTGVVASITSNEVYALTLPFFDGTIFLISAGLVFVVFILLLCISKRIREQEEMEQPEPVQ